MLRPLRSISSLLVLGGAAFALAGCGGGGANPVTGATSAPANTAGFTSVRFVDGSPDANSGNAVDFNIDGTTVLPGYAYGGVTPYYDIPSGSGHSFGAYFSGSTSAVLAGVSLTATGSQAYTFVLAGQKANGTQHWIVYTDPPYQSTTQQFAYTVHDASPYADANGITSFQFGTFAPPAGASTTYTGPTSATAGYPPASAQTSPATPYAVVATTLAPVSAASNPGAEFFVAPATPATGATLPATSLLLPSAINANDTANVIPNSIISPAFYHASLFVIDSTTSPYYKLTGGQD